MNKQQVFGLSVRAACTAGLICATSVGAAVIDVTPSSMGSWTFYKTDPSFAYGGGDGVGQMVTGPAAPPSGTGSASFNTGTDGQQSVQIRNSGDWVGTKIADLTALGYSTYATAWNGQQVPYLTIYLDTDGDISTYEDRLWFEPDFSSATAGNVNPNPTQPETALNLWQTWNALGGMWYSDNHAGAGSAAISLAAYLLLEPDATIVDDVPGGKGGIRITSGFASPGDTFDANVDAFIIGTGAGTTTYNFDPNAVVPEPATLALLGIGLAGLGVRRRKVAA